MQAKKYILVLTKNELQFMRNFLILDDDGFDRTIIGALPSKIVLISSDDLIY